MTTARDELAEVIRDGIGAHGFTVHGLADAIIKAMPSFSESVCQELAALLNPWRPIETAPKDRPILVANSRGVREAQWVVNDAPGERSEWSSWPFGYAPTRWLPLPAPPSEDKA
jgi:hypothetical protein